MRPPTRTLRQALYPVFLFCCAAAVIAGLLIIWDVGDKSLVGRLFGTFSIVAVGSALAISTAKQVGCVPDVD